MMYHNKFVAAIKVGGKVLREQNSRDKAGLITLPFGAEYSILLKNLNSVRALATVSIDGQSVTDGTELILQPNSSIDLERYIRNGNYERGNRFKFIERTEAIENHRGVKADDGLIRVEYKFEKLLPSYNSVTTTWMPYNPPPTFIPYTMPTQPFYGWSWNNSGTAGHPNFGTLTNTSNNSNSHNMMRSYRSSAGRTASRSLRSIGSQSITMESPTMDSGITEDFGSDAGITVPGSESSQKFVAGSWFPTESQSEVIVLRLRGEVAGVPVQVPITVERKLKCGTCGINNKSFARFCSQCGTAVKFI